MALFLRCPAQFCGFRYEIWTLYLNRTCKQTEILPVLFYFFRDVIVAFVYVCGSLCQSYLSNKQKKKLRLAFQFVHDKHRVKNSSIFVILSGAWPIYRSGNILAGPAPAYHGEREEGEEEGLSPLKLHKHFLVQVTWNKNRTICAVLILIVKGFK